MVLSCVTPPQKWFGWAAETTFTRSLVEVYECARLSLLFTSAGGGVNNVYLQGYLAHKKTRKRGREQSL